MKRTSKLETKLDDLSKNQAGLIENVNKITVELKNLKNEIEYNSSINKMYRNAYTVGDVSSLDNVYLDPGSILRNPDILGKVSDSDLYDINSIVGDLDERDDSSKKNDE